VAQSEADNAGFIPSEVGLRALAPLLPKLAENPQRLPVVKEGSSEKTGNSSLSPLCAKGPGPEGKTCPVHTRRSKPWQAVTTTLLLLTFALVLLTHAASIVPSTDETAADSANESQPADTDSTNSTQAGSDAASQPTTQLSNRLLTLSSTEASRPSAAVRRHPSGYDFVAEDFTNHFDAHARTRATLQNPELKNNAQAKSERKRVVDN
jgi:hypothetical protein